ncbi:DUF5996 family protein [Christiangramia salexigens]|uniref:Uncharacterized protein n=1 Tax=Christiangramia salexigens TaxID=1913577 RepID=A0A1L3J442_9FLAO|nr:DUF5996 family protein [Christiangramia salexigens]APG59886.1 hypothetical protein LPB144_05410 [Christiangramia salexigens]
MKNSDITPVKWPVLDFTEMQDTIETLHQWIQILGKIRLKSMPWQNHSWHTTFYITSTGYSTNPIPYEGCIFQIDLDFKKHQLIIKCSETEALSMDLYPRTVADFYTELFDKLSSLGINIRIHPKPNEIEPAIPFAENIINKAYDPDTANKLWRAMLRTNEVFSKFRSDFIGKASPVHLFWGAFDLAVTRFSGKKAPLHPGGMPNMSLKVMQEAYSQEVSSAGFWPGSKDSPTPVYYSYAYPADKGFGEQKVLPKEAFYNADMGEFFLKYEDVQTSENPEKTIMDFLQTTYEAAAITSGWDRASLEKHLEARD